MMRAATAVLSWWAADTAVESEEKLLLMIEHTLRRVVEFNIAKSDDFPDVPPWWAKSYRIPAYKLYQRSLEID